MSPDNYSRHISHQANSGLSILAYCRKYSLTYHTFLYRKKRFDSQTSPLAGHSAFAEVTPTESQTVNHANIIVGVSRIQVPLSASLDQWKVILQALAAATSC